MLRGDMSINDRPCYETSNASSREQPSLTPGAGGRSCGSSPRSLPFHAGKLRLALMCHQSKPLVEKQHREQIPSFNAESKNAGCEQLTSQTVGTGIQIHIWICWTVPETDNVARTDHSHRQYNYLKNVFIYFLCMSVYLASLHSISTPAYIHSDPSALHHCCLQPNSPFKS